jgi:hypothetical protein
MRAKLGVVAVGLIAIGALVAPANTKTAEARSNVAATVGTVLEPPPPPPPPVLPASQLSLERAASPATAAPLEVITPPPADLRLENPKLRRMHKEEITASMLVVSAKIVRKHYAKPVGTQVEVEVDGKRVIARIERHFHPEGGPVKPWGFHPGVSLFVAR